MFPQLHTQQETVNKTALLWLMLIRTLYKECEIIGKTQCIHTIPLYPHHLHNFVARDYRGGKMQCTLYDGTYFACVF